MSDGHCTEGARCVCGGDLPSVRAGCHYWRASAPKQAQETSLPPQGASSHAWRNPLNRSAWVDAVAVASFAPMTGKVVLDARVVLEANSLLSASPAPAPQEPAAEPDHELKTWPPFFEDVLSGRKTFEVRKNDRGFAVGHVVRLNEWAPDKGYTGRFVDKRITYMLTGPQFGIEAGYSVLALYASPAHQEPARPDILEKLTYHQHERDDLTLDECLEVLASGYRKVHGRTDRQMVMQILALLAASPAPGALGAVDAEAEDAAPASVSGYGALAAMDLLRRIEPHIDAIVCYASTCDEHEPNLIAKDLRTLLHSYPHVPAFAWRPIETAQWQERALLYAPPENLYEKPQGRPGEFRVARRADWTWATHWMPLPQPPQQAPSDSSAQGSGGEKA